MKTSFWTFLVLSILVTACSGAPENPKTDPLSGKPEEQLEDLPPPSTDDLVSANLGSQDSAQKQDKHSAPAEKKEAANDGYQKFSDAMKSKQYKLAADAAAYVLAKNPNDSKILNGLAVIAIDQGKLDLARMHLSKILSKGQNSAAFNNLGVVELKSDNLRLALVNFKRAVELDSSNRAAHANLGTIYLQYRNYQGATDQLQLAVNNGDETAATYSNLGFALKGLGRFDDAQDAYEKSLTKDGSSQTTLYNYAVLLMDNLNDTSKAMKFINKLRMAAREPGILEKANQLARKAEGKQNGKNP